MTKSEERIIKLSGCEGKIVREKVGKYTINYFVSGKGKPLILIHGANIGWGQWYPNIADFAKEYKVYAIDLPGSGNSSKVDYYTSDLDKVFVDTVCRFIKQKKLHKPIIIGHSIGGWVALKLALRNECGVKKIVLVNSVGLSRKMPNMYRVLAFKSVVTLMKNTVFKPSRKMVNGFFESSVFNKNAISDEFVDYYYQNLKKGSHPLELMHLLSGLFFIKEHFVLIDKFQEIKCPMLFVVGDKDAMTPKTDIVKNSKLNKKSIVKIIKNAGHVVGIDKPKLHNSLILEFIKD